MHLIALLAVAVFPLLVVTAALTDATSYTIPNRLSLLAVGAYPLAALAAGLSLPVLGLSLALGGVALLIGMALFALRVVGGGDAKLMAACGLWLGWSGFTPFLVWTALAGGALAVGLLIGRKLHAHLPSAFPAWLRRLLTPGETVPYGVAIAVGALVVFPASPVVLAAHRLAG